MFVHMNKEPATVASAGGGRTQARRRKVAGAVNSEAAGSTQETGHGKRRQVPGERLLKCLLNDQFCAERTEREAGRPVTCGKVDAVHAGNGAQQR